MAGDRRTDLRVPVEIYMSQYIDNRPYRSLVSDLSASGLHTSRLIEPMSRATRFVQLELPLPGTGDTIWAKGEVVYDAIDPFFHGSGIRFAAMARYHESMLREWVEEARREVLRRMIRQIRAQRGLPTD